MLSKIPKQFYFFLTAIFILNVIQSSFTQLIFDEAYYWYYSQNMAWGYFDHPPMVAFLVKISSFFFNGELGVRFMSCVLSTINIVLLWLMIDNPKKNDYIKHFFVLIFSMTLLNAYGFFTLPDTPLLFFTSCFLLTYKYFIKNQTLALSVLLGIFMAALMYSKYHAVLVIFFVLLSNLKLIRNKYAWLSVVVALICYAPHFYWLFENDLVSIKYHLYERPNGAYSFEKYTLGFFVNLVAVFGLTFPFIYKALFKTKSNNLFNKALIYLTYGVILFFFVSSFNRRVQTQWIIIICIPLVVIAFNYMLHNKQALTWIFRLGIINTVIILYLRVGLAYQPLLFTFYYETHGNKEWATAIKDEVGNRPVVFENSYRNAPMYSFYTNGTPTFSLNNFMYRKNQYSIDNSEEKIRNKDVAYVSKYSKDNTFTYTREDGGIYKGKYIPNFQSYRKLECILKDNALLLNSDENIELKIYNPYKETIDLTKLKFAVTYMDDYKIPKETLAFVPEPTDPKTTALTQKDTTHFNFKLPKTNKENIGYFRVVISENNLLYGLNGKPIPIK
ncbi:ArnT family glycosyltransferase [Maribacter hydrothermalis]|uniref:4-amino-4-deoxy-L-arabinose transferase n=1 Tax=Maribacter hydrothermalis TaxID=1836467 RepID=A0A1B7Z3G4_9FLAO|nr:glycosyltransferase family 39 protein [Maribacter hydrothermalis]APQ17011.1 4-amino-4-deoxy-L-arabinose transferase [Maribacter hydrothermalis]OBR37272.1 4-amino-4-deoxy-L-arabinose transferase [Maribacter hydrothermalis]